MIELLLIGILFIAVDLAAWSARADSRDGNDWRRHPRL